VIGKGGGSRTWRLCAFRQGTTTRRSKAGTAAKPWSRGGETPDQPHNRHVPTNRKGMTLQVEGLRWHDPDHAYARCPVVGAPSRSECYGVVAPPRSWGRGIRNAAHCTPSTAFLYMSRGREDAKDFGVDATSDGVRRLRGALCRLGVRLPRAASDQEGRKFLPLGGGDAIPGGSRRRPPRRS